MRPIYGFHENFPESLTTPTATFPEIFNGLFLIRLQNLKSVALPVPEIIAIGVLAFWVGSRTQSWGSGGRRGSWMVLQKLSGLLSLAHPVYSLQIMQQTY